MGLWRFVTASGMTWADATAGTRDFLAGVTLADLQAPDLWSKLTTLVRVQPDADTFPVRASYEGEALPTIGANNLSSTSPQWFTLADCIASKLLTGKAPAILYCMGHFEPQRLTREPGKTDVPQQMANFAKMGFITLVLDMIGKVDSKQITHDYGREEKDLWQSNGLGVQLWNNIRALDLLCSMPEVDAENIGVTGASGGGSQTLFLSLIDDRIKAAAPINMISLRMQGGCQCENAEGLRRHTDNAEMCAMIAPRPLFLAGSTGDWTRYLETDELPGVLEAYRQYDAEDMVEHLVEKDEFDVELLLVELLQPGAHILLQLLLRGCPTRRKGGKECRQRAVEILLYKLFALQGMKLVLGDPHSHHTLFHGEDPSVTELFQHRIGGGSLPLQLLLTQLHQFPGGHRRMLPDNIGKAAFHHAQVNRVHKTLILLSFLILVYHK
jgi:hypothetical protein